MTGRVQRPIARPPGFLQEILAARNPADKFMVAADATVRPCRAQPPDGFAAPRSRRQRACLS
eukprot:4104739-Prymnesium_polylepis.1